MNVERLREKSAIADHPTRDFLLEAVSLGVHSDTPKYLTPERWAGNLFLTARWCLGEQNNEELGARYGISRQAVHQRVSKTVAHLWRMSSPDVRERYPLEALSVSKDYAGLRVTHLRDEIHELQESGMEADAVLESLEMDAATLSRRRSYARKRGIEIPTLFIKSKYESAALARSIRQSDDPEELQKIFDREVSYYFYQRDRKLESPVLMSIKEVAGRLFQSNRDVGLVAQVLKERGVPVGVVEWQVKSGVQQGNTQRYFFIPRHFLEEAQSVLDKDDRLNPFRESPVEQLAGPGRSELPRIADLKMGEFRSVGLLCESLGLTVRRRGAQFQLYELLGEDCPVPVYVYTKGGNYYYPSDQEEELQLYLHKRARSLG